MDRKQWKSHEKLEQNGRSKIKKNMSEILKVEFSCKVKETETNQTGFIAFTGVMLLFMTIIDKNCVTFVIPNPNL